MGSNYRLHVEGQQNDPEVGLVKDEFYVNISDGFLNWKPAALYHNPGLHKNFVIDKITREYVDPYYGFKRGEPTAAEIRDLNKLLTAFAYINNGGYSVDIVKKLTVKPPANDTINYTSDGKLIYYTRDDLGNPVRHVGAQPSYVHYVYDDDGRLYQRPGIYSNTYEIVYHYTGSPLKLIKYVNPAQERQDMERSLEHRIDRFYSLMSEGRIVEAKKVAIEAKSECKELIKELISDNKHLRLMIAFGTTKNIASTNRDWNVGIRTLGALQSVGGLAQAGSSLLLAALSLETGVGPVFFAATAASGLDSAVTGAKIAITGEDKDTYFVKAIESMGGNPKIANLSQCALDLAVPVQGLAALKAPKLSATFFAKSAKRIDKIPISGWQDAEKALNSMESAQAKNLQRFIEKLPKNSENIRVRDFLGGKIFQADSPAANIPGSFARYEKQIDATGNTILYTKTTYGPNGKIVHVAPKFPAGSKIYSEPEIKHRPRLN